METIDDIVKWLRNGCEEFASEIAIQKINNPHYDAEACLGLALGVLADRIKKAENHGYHALQVHLKKLEGEYENELAEKSRIIAERNELEELNRKCCDENELLHAALKPVLDAKTHASDQQEHEDMPYYKVLVKCHNAVRKAQEIYKQGEKSDE